MGKKIIITPANEINFNTKESRDSMKEIKKMKKEREALYKTSTIKINFFWFLRRK